MIDVPFAHVGGIPLEETLGSLGPALLVGFGAASAKLRARLRRVRSRASAHAPPRNKAEEDPDRVVVSYLTAGAEAQVVDNAELEGATPLMQFAGDGAMTFTY
jgi:hypothetical protein